MPVAAVGFFTLEQVIGITFYALVRYIFPTSFALAQPSPVRALYSFSKTSVTLLTSKYIGVLTQALEEL